MKNKLETLKTVLDDSQLDAIVSFSQQTRLWLTGINTSFGYLFIEQDEVTLFVDGRYIEIARKNAKNCNVQLIQGTVIKDFAEQKKYSRIGIESEYLVMNEKDMITNLFPNALLIPFSAASLRLIKSDEEIEKIRMACQIALKSLESIKHLIKDGVSEKEIDAELERAIRLNGAEKGSFDAIIASGFRSSLPHGRASNKILRNGEFITIDFGAYYEGYASDITRTFHVGTVTNQRLLEIEKILREAQKLGVESVKPGINASMIDDICRNYITDKGYGEYFTHSTGHGLGIDVHELPNISSKAKTNFVLEPGMVFTVEPGIYIEGLGGIRVEDDVLVTKTGYEVLSKIQK